MLNIPDAERMVGTAPVTITHTHTAMQHGSVRSLPPAGRPPLVTRLHALSVCSLLPSSSSQVWHRHAPAPPPPPPLPPLSQPHSLLPPGHFHFPSCVAQAPEPGMARLPFLNKPYFPPSFSALVTAFSTKKSFHHSVRGGSGGSVSTPAQARLQPGHLPPSLSLAVGLRL